MIYKKLGKSDIKISALGFGGGIGGSKSSTSNYEKIGESLLRSLDLGVKVTELLEQCSKDFKDLS